MLLLAACLAFGCAPHKVGRKKTGPEADGITMRANPGYVQLLERQSLLYGARDLSSQVTGSERAFIAPSTGNNVKMLLEAAGIWLDLRPNMLITSNFRPVMAELAEGGVLDLLAASGIKGVHIAPMGEPGSVWLDPRKGDPIGEDAVSFSNAENVGTEKDFELLASRAEAKGIQIGSDLVPAATGIGPDFLLALRNVRDFPGLYLMNEAPKELWPLLPMAGDGQGAPLDAKSMAELSRPSQPGLGADGGKNTRLPAMARDNLPFAARGGWAVSGEVAGVDGVKRRWFYRYAQNPSRPALNWDDPSGAAKRVFSASVILNTGVRRMALAGLRLEAFFGLDLASGAGAKLSLEPGPSATRDISREIHRYGGWSVFMDRMPEGMTGQLQEAGVDFVRDPFTSPTAEYAVLSGDAAPLRAALQNSLASGVDHSRLARGLASPEGLDFSPIVSGPGGREAAVKIEEILRKNSSWGLSLKNLRLAAPPAALAAISAGISPEKAVRDGTGEILKRHLLPLLFRAALPGMLFVSGPDMSGSLKGAQGGDGAFSLGASGSMTRHGVARSPEAYPSIAAQAGKHGTFLGELAYIAQLRDKTKIAAGRLEAVLKTARPGSVAALSRLPGGEYLLAVANFSSSDIQENIALPGRMNTARITDLVSEKRFGSDSGRAFSVALEPWQCRILLIEGR